MSIRRPGTGARRVRWMAAAPAALLSAAVVAVPAMAEAAEPTTPIKHVVVIFQENVSFDHYFGTYPKAANTDGTKFEAKPNTPGVNGYTKALLENNPNGDAPYRLPKEKAMTCDMYHGYTAEQMAYNAGRVDGFEIYTAAKDKGCHPKQVMAYFDGNTVTALWNYAQHFALSDNTYGSTYGPSTPGALNLMRGNTHNAVPDTIEGHVTAGTLYGDLDPTYDDCSGGTTVAIEGKMVGDLLNEKGITWGWFQGGFKPTEMKDGKAVCGSKHKNIAGDEIGDYIPHHNPLQYFKQHANPHHLPPESVEKIGHTDQAKHNYDLEDFWKAVDAGNMPQVSFLKAPGYQDGHAGYSNPVDEQDFLVGTINRLMESKYWDDTAIIIAYDDSDGWYDHVMPPVLQESDLQGVDMLFGENGRCGEPGEGVQKGRCGLGPRVPLLVVSPYAKQNYVDHRILEQASVLRFIEDNWNLGRIGNQSFDERAENILTLFDFDGEKAPKLILAKDGSVKQ